MSGNDAKDPPQVQTRAGQPLFLHRQVATSQTPMTDQRTTREVFAPGSDGGPKSPTAFWDSLWSTKLDQKSLLANGLFTDPTSSDLAAHFDVLRTRLLLQVASSQWVRIAVTSPTPGCGKSFVAANLALSVARLPACRTLLVDLDLQAPQQASLFNRADVPPLSACLLGRAPIETQLQRVGQNLAVALNGKPEPRPYEILQDPVTIQALNDLHTRLQPDLSIFDLPSALESDDMLAMTSHLDAVLLVVDGTCTTPEEIRRCTQLLDGHIPLAGIVLNKAQDRGLGRMRRHPRRTWARS
jgi:protein-tyrosine kinase